MENQIRYRPPVTFQLDNGNIQLAQDWKVLYNGWVFTVPRGFVSDGNSVPKLLRWLVPQYGANTIAGIAHDWLYHTGTIINLVRAEPIKITQRQADIIRLDLCRWCQVHWFQRLCSYLGLRIGGWWRWNQARRKERELKGKKKND